MHGVVARGRVPGRVVLVRDAGGLLLRAALAAEHGHRRVARHALLVRDEADHDDAGLGQLQIDLLRRGLRGEAGRRRARALAVAPRPGVRRGDADLPVDDGRGHGAGRSGVVRHRARRPALRGAGVPRRALAALRRAVGGHHDVVHRRPRRQRREEEQGAQAQRRHGTESRREHQRPQMSDDRRRRRRQASVTPGRCTLLADAPSLQVEALSRPPAPVSQGPSSSSKRCTASGAQQELSSWLNRRGMRSFKRRQAPKRGSHTALSAASITAKERFTLAPIGIAAAPWCRQQQSAAAAPFRRSREPTADRSAGLS